MKNPRPGQKQPTCGGPCAWSPLHLPWLRTNLLGVLVCGRRVHETAAVAAAGNTGGAALGQLRPVFSLPEEQFLQTSKMAGAFDPNRKVEIASVWFASMLDSEFFTEYGEATQYQIQEVVGKGSYGVVGAAVDTHTGEKVAIKKINDVFEHVSDATRILREIKLLRLLRHPDIVEIKHIMLPPSRREFRDIYVVFELMESDLHQVIKANDDLTPEHYQFFLYQLLRAMKYIHSANVFHRDLKPKNILANADCKLKVCDFGLARVSFNDAPSAIFWTDYVATRWYRAPELCGSFFSKVNIGGGDLNQDLRLRLFTYDVREKLTICIILLLWQYTPAIDIWSIGCIFSEMLTGKPLFPGKNVVHQLDLMTDLLGTPSAESIARIRNEKARRYLGSMRKKNPIPFSQKFPHVDPLALRLLEKLLAFDPKDRPTAEEGVGGFLRGGAKRSGSGRANRAGSRRIRSIPWRTADPGGSCLRAGVDSLRCGRIEPIRSAALADPYFHGLANVDREPATQPISKLEFEFERRKLSKDDVRELIYREILEYHPQMLQEYLRGADPTSFMYPSGVDRFKRQFAHLEEHYGKGERSSPLQRQHASLPRERVCSSKDEAGQNNDFEKRTSAAVARSVAEENGPSRPNYSSRCLVKSDSISASKCVVVKSRSDPKEEPLAEQQEDVDGLSQKVAALYA
ncbi:hypothetical protein Taro_020993 [Colocasia esculenta]|uniref:Protein kinase domain-containing protein n=1 Tax=Colocasia esculenta TaxID=4460 RepID=A0A843V164_COLES|nr:hypothetical protein [Colocasia esculenta]